MASNLPVDGFVFLGDADPYDLAIYTSLLALPPHNRAIDVCYGGLGVDTLQALDARTPASVLLDRISSPLAEGEIALRRALLALPGVPTVVADALEGITRLLGNRKVELEALLHSGLFAPNRVRSAVRKAMQVRAKSRRTQP